MKKIGIVFITVLFLICLCACDTDKTDKEETIEPKNEPVEQEIIPETKDEKSVEETDEQIEEKSEKYIVTVLDEGTIIYTSIEVVITTSSLTIYSSSTYCSVIFKYTVIKCEVG